MLCPRGSCGALPCAGLSHGAGLDLGAVAMYHPVYYDMLAHWRYSRIVCCRFLRLPGASLRSVGCAPRSPARHPWRVAILTPVISLPVRLGAVFLDDRRQSQFRSLTARQRTRNGCRGKGEYQIPRSTTRPPMPGHVTPSGLMRHRKRTSAAPCHRLDFNLTSSPSPSSPSDHPLQPTTPGPFLSDQGLLCCLCYLSTSGLSFFWSVVRTS